MATQKFLQDGAGPGLDGTFQAPTIADLTAIANNTVLANISGGAAAPAADTLTAILDAIIGNSRGTILVRGASTWGALALGLNGQVLESNGTDLVYVTPVTTPAGTLVSIQTFPSSQTVTIPATATKAFIRLCGDGGAGAGAGSASTPGAGGGGAYLEKYLTGLTAGNTLTLQVGTGGAAPANSGQGTILSSGTQVISTLTAGGGVGVTNGVGAGGTATGGDLNIPGSTGMKIVSGTTLLMVIGGASPLSGNGAGNATTAGHFPGQGGTATAAAGNAGAAGFAQIWWFV